MKTLLKTAVLCMAAGWAVIPAHAQLGYYMDDRGNLVYTNDDAPHTSRAAGEKTSAQSELNRSGSQLRATAQPTEPVGTELLHRMVQETAQKHNVDPALVSAVIATESNWNTS